MRLGRGGPAQASIELLAALPALALATALALQLLLVGYSLTIADGAAEAGALAGASGHDEQRAARDVHRLRATWLRSPHAHLHCGSALLALNRGEGL